MADKIELLLEAEKRGILPPGKKAVLDEARRRGLVSGGPLSQGHSDMTAQAQASVDQAINAGGDAKQASFLQGALFNYGDELIGAIEAIKNPLKPEAYKLHRDQARTWLDAAQAERPGYALGGGLATAIPAAIATGGASLPAVLASGAAQGAVSGYGATEGNDLKAVGDVAQGAAFGAAGGAAGFGVGKLVEKFLTRGLAAATIQKALSGKPGELILKIRQLGGSAAEADEVLREVLKGQAAKNPTAATAAVPGAQQRLAQVNSEVQQKVNDIISPDNAQLLIKRLKDEAQKFSKGAYEKAYGTEGAVGLVPELANNPGLKPAIDAAQKLAAMEGRPFDLTALSVKDLDAMQRALRGETDKLFKEGGAETIFGPVKSSFRDDINNLAKSMSQDFADVQARYAQNAAQREAVKLGTQALNPSKEYVEVAEEFAKLSGPEQEAYRAAIATRARTLLQGKQPTANAAVALKPEAIIEKLKAVGFPEEELQALIQKGAGARGVVDALQGGSDTARKLAAAKASESPMTKVQSGDLAAAALVHPVTLGALPAMRSLGQQQEQRVAAMLIKALTDQNPGLLQNLLTFAPQKLTGPLGLSGGAAASQIGQPR